MRRTFLPATLIVLVAITPALIRGQNDQKLQQLIVNLLEQIVLCLISSHNRKSRS